MKAFTARFGRHAATTIALLSALGALAAALLLYKQIHDAETQAEATEQQSLTSLVGDITQKTDALLAAPQQQQDAANAILADADQGLQLVRSLINQGQATLIAPVDEYELGLGFENSEEYDGALFLYHLAAAGDDPHYRVFALRGMAEVNYRLAIPVSREALSARPGGSAVRLHDAQAEIREAYLGYVHVKDVTPDIVARSGAYTDLFDILSGPPDCARWGGELADAERLIGIYPHAILMATGPSSVRYELYFARLRIVEARCASFEFVASRAVVSWARDLPALGPGPLVRVLRRSPALGFAELTLLRR